MLNVGDMANYGQAGLWRVWRIAETEAGEMGDDLPTVDLGNDHGTDGISGTADDVPYTATAIAAGEQPHLRPAEQWGCQMLGIWQLAVSWAMRRYGGSRRRGRGDGG